MSQKNKTKHWDVFSKHLLLCSMSFMFFFFHFENGTSFGKCKAYSDWNVWSFTNIVVEFKLRHRVSDRIRWGRRPRRVVILTDATSRVTSPSTRLPQTTIPVYSNAACIKNTHTHLLSDYHALWLAFHWPLYLIEGSFLLSDAIECYITALEHCYLCWGLFL